jgi:hypothetical protein
MDCAAGNIHDYIIAIIFILMNHWYSPLKHEEKPLHSSAQGSFLSTYPSGQVSPCTLRVLVPDLTRQNFLRLNLSVGVLAALVAYGAGSLACGLAGSLALAAAALFHGFFQILVIQSLNMFHMTASY